MKCSNAEHGEARREDRPDGRALVHINFENRHSQSCRCPQPAAGTRSRLGFRRGRLLSQPLEQSNFSKLLCSRAVPVAQRAYRHRERRGVDSGKHCLFCRSEPLTLHASKVSCAGIIHSPSAKCCRAGHAAATLYGACRKANFPFATLAFGPSRFFHARAVKLFCAHALWYGNRPALPPNSIDRTLNSKKRLPLFFFQVYRRTIP